MLKLSSQWGEFFRSQPETGMGYWICSVVLKNGRVLQRVIVDGGMIASVNDSADIPFDESDISKFIVTHDNNGEQR